MLDLTLDHHNQHSYWYDDYDGFDSRNYWLSMMENLPECYDEDWFPIVAVKNICERVDWKEIDRIIHEERFNSLVEELFQ